MRTIFLLTGILTLGIGLCLTSSTQASTAAFAGKVIEVKPAPKNDRDGLVHFTVRIGHFEYISWSKFGPHSKVGETITRRVKKLGTACVINGRLVNADTFAKAIQPGMWGYFYEDTWLDLHTTPDFRWGEVVKAGNNEFTIREHFSHIDYHTKTNPPKTSQVKFDNKTQYRLEDRKVDAKQALKPGHWVQVHEPRPQIVSVWTAKANFDPNELQPVEQGKRGFANDMTCPAVLKQYESAHPEQVTNAPLKLTAQVQHGNKVSVQEFDCRKTALLLDGKPCPLQIAFRPGRKAVLGHYRSEKRPHKVLVYSESDCLRGTLVDMNKEREKGVMVLSRDKNGKKVGILQTPKYTADTVFFLNGRRVNQEDAFRENGDVVIYPQRGRTIIAFAPHLPGE